jgi:hypothetical protein
MIWPRSTDEFGGLIGGDMLKRYDVEFNFVTRKVNFFSPDHCEGKVIYWPATAFVVVPFSMAPPPHGNPATWAPSAEYDSQIYVPVTLDGKSFQAMIDTGAPNTTMSAATAERAFGITARSPGAVPSSNPDQGTFGYVFHNLSFGGIAASNPHIMIFPDVVGKNDPDNTAITGSMIMRNDDGMQEDLIIGMDVLAKLHLYIAYGEKKLYITPPDQPATAATEH